MTGSTLYRRLSNGSWASEREDVPRADPKAEGAPKPGGASSAGAPAAGPPPPPRPSAAKAAASAPPHEAPPPGPPPRTGAQPTPPAPGKRRRWRIWRIVMWAFVAYSVWLVFLVGYAANSLTKTDGLSANPIANTSGSVWLMVGSDSREGLTAKEQRELRTGTTEGQRTDTIMLVHQRLGQAPTLVSLPRDSWVTIPEYTNSSGSVVGAHSAKINSAYAFGGAPLLAETVEYNTGLRVDHYMEIGFAGIVNMTDAVGGVEACFDRAIKDKNSGLDVKKGCHNLDGPESLAWVRMRYADPEGDLGRIDRQQQYMAAMAKKVVSPWTLVNPVRQWQLVNAVLDSVVLDDDSGMLNLGGIGFGMGRIATGSGEILTVPVNETDRWEAGQSVIKWDEEEARELFESMGARSVPATAG